MELVEFDKLPKLEDIQEIALDDPIKIFKICQEMEIICNKENGIGLSAVQVGLGIQLFIVKNQSSYEYYANCKYVGMERKFFPSKDVCQFVTIRESFVDLNYKGSKRLNSLDLNWQFLQV